MSSEIELVSDGDGLAIIGRTADVERFLESEGLTSRDLGLPRLRRILVTGGAVTQAGSEVAENSGRWVKLTKASAEALKKYDIMGGSSANVSRAVVTQNGKTKHVLEFAKSSRSFLTNPALLAGAAGLMAQVAMQQTMDEITDYLATIDAKVDDVLRGQKDAVLASMIGAGLVMDEAMKVREHSGVVNEVTWSKVQTVPATVAETQAYALRQLDAVARKIERENGIGDLAKCAKDAESEVAEWLAVLARCFQLQDAVAVLELDRVLAADPDDLDGHRVGLQAARRDRQSLISSVTARLMMRIDAAAVLANAKVLLHPMTAPAVVQSSNHVATSLAYFNGLLGIEDSRMSLESTPWVVAATETRDKALVTGARGVSAAKLRSGETVDRARSATAKFSIAVGKKARRREDKD